MMLMRAHLDFRWGMNNRSKQNRNSQLNCLHADVPVVVTQTLQWKTYGIWNTEAEKHNKHGGPPKFSRNYRVLKKKKKVYDFFVSLSCWGFLFCFSLRKHPVSPTFIISRSFPLWQFPLFLIVHFGQRAVLSGHSLAAPSLCYTAQFFLRS